MNILVTGGAGFIGSHLVDALVAQGHRVVVVDNLSTGFAGNLHPDARFYQVSVTDPDLASVFQQERPEMVSHQAAQMNLARSMSDPLFDAEENILGSLNVIEQCVHFGVRRLVYASSAAVYGDPEYLPVDERHPTNPISHYGVSKHTVEHYLYLYGLQSSLEWVSLRYANIYGARQSPHGEAGVVPIFATQMLNRDQPTIFGPGDKTRDYTHVSDVVRANLAALERGRNGIYNIGTGVQTSDLGIFKAVAMATGYEGDPQHAPLRPGDIYHMCQDSSLAQRELGWKARVSLAEGLSLTLDYYRTLAAARARR